MTTNIEVHTVTLQSDGDRMGSHYGQYMYVERFRGSIVKMEHLGYDYEKASLAARGIAKTYGADYVAGPERSNWSAD